MKSIREEISITINTKLNEDRALVVLPYEVKRMVRDIIMLEERKSFYGGFLWRKLG